jgi:heme exporter protein B
MEAYQQIKSLIAKELLVEWRNKYAFNGLILYVFSTIFVCFLSFKQINPLAWNALFWIIMLFAASNSLGRSFAQESRYRFLYHYQLVSPLNLMLAKIVYNSALLLLIGGVALFFYSIVFKNPVQDMPLYVGCVVLGALSFSSVMTMVAAIASKMNNGGTLMAILSFPIMVPLLMLLIKCSKNALDGLDRASSYNELGAIALLNLITIVLSLLLFPYIWRD